MLDSKCAAITSFSSHTSGARGLKVGMHNPYMNGSKDINFWTFCLEAEIFKFKVLNLPL